METNRLRQFCTVVETGNLRKAALLLGISHSGLFKSLKVLEDEIGHTLFLPSGRNIIVSDQGQLLYDKSQPFFRALDQLLGKTEAITQDILRVGSFEVFTTQFMSQFVQTLLASTAVEIHELIPGKLEEALSLGRIDIGITYEPIPRPKIDYVKVGKIAMGAYATTNFLRARSKTFSEIPFAVPVNPLEGSPSGVKGLDAWPEAKWQRNARFRVELLSTGLELTQSSLCAIFIPKFLAKLINQDRTPKVQLKALPLPSGMPTIYRDVYVVRRESSVHDPKLKLLMSSLRSICE